MTDPVVSSEPAVPGNPITMAADLRRVTVLSAAIAVLGVVVGFVVGQVLMGVFAVLGMALGLLNAYLVRRAAARFAEPDAPSKASFAMSSLGRLALITVLAVTLALLIRPAGLGVFIGLAAFQLLMIGVGVVPLLKELRASEGLGK